MLKFIDKLTGKLRMILRDEDSEPTIIKDDDTKDDTTEENQENETTEE